MKNNFGEGSLSENTILFKLEGKNGFETEKIIFEYDKTDDDETTDDLYDNITSKNMILF